MKTVKLNLCPFRIYTEIRPPILQGDGDIIITGFIECMECLEHKCPAFYTKDEYIPGTGVGQIVEHCKRLEVRMMDVKRYCRYTGNMCEFATEFGYCKITVCVKGNFRY